MHWAGTPGFYRAIGKAMGNLEAAKVSTYLSTDRCFRVGSSRRYTFLAEVVIAQNLELSRNPKEMGHSF